MNTPKWDGIYWRKSTYSASNGDCVEVGWRKSTHSASNGGCVEVAAADRVHVRDTKDRVGGSLSFSRAQWRAFVTQVLVGP
ncbi:DUF397 domain-containing protein [Amycolatopsis anabasis]|uniref:DUF397 domain-containing protein n=1 Tax=Amycolatopsis anabasis TaxID=1840409 RepID=UPI00131C91EE|nr:DUF397 domain-containing protein [Amycolatopsis anabasis]